MRPCSRWSLLPIVAVWAAVSLPVLAAAPDPPPLPGDRAVFRSSVELVALNVTVTDAKRQYVPDLRAGDFEILEDGVPQPISFFGGGRVPIDLFLLIDTSSSMGSLRPVVQRAAAGFLSVLRPTDRAAVIGFNERMTVLQDLTNDLPALAGGLRRAGASGNTALFNALYVALHDFGRPARQTSEVRRQAFVVLSDGEENKSGVELDGLLESARSRGVAVYGILLSTSDILQREHVLGRLRPARQAMKQLALETGAAAFFPRSADDLDATYGRIARELENQYSLGYLPPATPRESQLRKVAVRVVSQPTLRATSRTTYLANGPTLMASAR
jgi:Ca-activated chloride channel homolog